jgi:hypothetical protein
MGYDFSPSFPVYVDSSSYEAYFRIYFQGFFSAKKKVIRSRTISLLRTCSIQAQKKTNSRKSHVGY